MSVIKSDFDGFMCTIIKSSLCYEFLNKKVSVPIRGLVSCIGQATCIFSGAQMSNTVSSK